jgi:hypothetical protein
MLTNTVRALRSIAVAALPFALGGCIFGDFFNYLSPAIQYGDRFGLVEGSFRAEPCEQTPLSGELVVHCQFGLPSGASIESRLRILGNVTEAKTWLDPLILQVPSGFAGFQGTLAGAGNGSLGIVTVNGPLPIDANRALTPEPGMKFVIVDFPNGAPPAGAGLYTFRFNYSVPAGFPGPLRVKAMLAARVLANGQTYYPPILPCVTSMAALPAVTLSTASAFTPIDLSPLAGQKGCESAVYSMTPGVPPATVVEFYNASLDHYFITWMPGEIAILDAGTTIKGWARTGRVFAAHTTPQSGTSEVCRFYIPPESGDSHFFGRGATECSETRAKFPTFVLEDPQYMHVALPAAGTCPAATVPVYRVFSNRTDANHRYTTDRAVRDQMVTMGWLAEGDGPDQVVMCAPA